MTISKRELNSYIIENAEIWTESEVISKGRIFVEGGVLKSYGQKVVEPSGTVKVDAKGAVVMPAGVDAQAHLRVPGQSHKETPETGMTAALKGGYCAVLTMPNTQPTIDCVEVLEQGRELVHPLEEDFGIQVVWSAAITKRLNSDECCDFKTLAKAGVRAFTNDGLGVLSDQVMAQAFAALESLDVPLLQHAEFLGHGGSLAPGSVQRQVGATPYPDDPEWKMVERDIKELSQHPKARYHVLHVSSWKTLELVEKAKVRGLNVSAEVTPHHLFFNSETIDGQNTSFKMNPPIRGAEDQQALWRALASGLLDFVATDHAPHEQLMKTGPFDKVAFGTLGLETTLMVLVDGYKKGLIGPKRIVEVFALRPAQFLGMPKGFGSFELGAIFHAVHLDVNEPARRYSEDQISSLSKNSCFVGANLPGKVLGAFHGTKVFTF